MSESAKKRMREIIEDWLQDATDALALMENKHFGTRDEKEVTTDKLIAERKTDVKKLTELLRQMDLL